MADVTPYAKDLLAVIRRIAERGVKYGQETENSRMVDLFQHQLDEIERLENELSDVRVGVARDVDLVEPDHLLGKTPD